MSNHVNVVVYGCPAPQGSKKFVGRTKEGRGLMVESSKKVKPWRQDVKAAATAVRNGAPALAQLLIDSCRAGNDEDKAPF